MTDKILIDRELLERHIEALEDLVALSKTLPPKNWIDIVENKTKKLRSALDTPQHEAVAWYCDAHGYTDNKDEAESWRDRGMPVTEYYPHPASSVPEGWQPVPKEPTPKMIDATWGDQIETSGQPESHNTRNHRVYRAMLSAAPKAPTTDDRKDAERWRYIRRHLCLTGNGDGTCQMQALNLPCRIQGWPEIGESLSFHDAAIDAAIAAQKGEKE